MLCTPSGGGFRLAKTALGLSLLLSSSAYAQDYLFDPMGFLPGATTPHSLAWKLSHDGSTAIFAGINNQSEFEYRLWTPGGGLQSLTGDRQGLTQITLDSISGDGATILGTGKNAIGKNEAFIWRADSGYQLLGVLGDPLLENSHASVISKDGQVAAGYSGNAMAGYMEAFRWTENRGMEGLGFLTDSSQPLRFSQAIAIDKTGDTVVGHSLNPDTYYEAFRWTENSGIKGLGFINGGGTAPSSMALYISDDGQVVTGISNNDRDFSEAFVWTESGAMQGLGFIDGGGLMPKSIPVAISADGRVIVGASSNSTTQDDSPIESFRWTAESGMVGLGFLGENTIHVSQPRALSDDGSTIVGLSSTALDTAAAYIWREEFGMISIQDFLASNGVNLDNWALQDASSVSGNGEVVIGSGTNPDGYSEGWMARIPKPEAPISPPIITDPTDPTTPTDPEPEVTPPPGFISINELNRSLSDMTYVPMAGLSVAQGALQDQRFIAAEQCGSDRQWDESDKRYCSFMTGSGEFWRGDGSQGRGSVGLAVRLSSSLTLGASAYLGHSDIDLRLNGKNRVDSYGSALFVNYTRGDEGVRAFGAVTANHLDYDIRRNYRNNTRLNTYSDGDSKGHSLGALARLGWAFRPMTDVAVIPFAEVSWARATIDGYRESNGTFPIDYDGRSADETDSRLGGELRYDINNQLNVNVNVAWVHRLSGSVDRVSGELIGVADIQSDKIDLPTDWSEVTLGSSYQLTSDMRVSAAATSTIGRSYQPDTSIRAGFTFKF